MKLVHYALPGGNFGDDLNLWLWDDVLPGWRDWAPEMSLMGVGTILSTALTPPGPKLVLGSGCGYGQLPSVNGPAWDIRAVRGPLTCDRLGLPARLAIADPAVLLPRLPRFAEVPPTGETLFVPHHTSDRTLDWAAICDRLGVAYQSPCADAETVIRRIAGAERVIAESMHAAIIADAFGVPWRAVEISRDFNRFKWRDWSRSLGLEEPEFQVFYALPRRLQAVMRRIKPKRPRTVPPGAHSQGSPAHVPPPKRKPYLAPLARIDLRRAMAGHFQLTDRGRLAAAQDRFLALLGDVAADYAARSREGTGS